MRASQFFFLREMREGEGERTQKKTFFFYFNFFLHVTRDCRRE